ncbi:effector-associated domain EAD1-containing protein [Dactylosporangium cerinum]|uniref:Effector-associated domain EAD1-containing protein n=1 Tax=Dactylosporangium cerinum TaxID=1434730 RepID=A0ABV9W8E4_9ACTN
MTFARPNLQPRDLLAARGILLAAFPDRQRLEELVMSCNHTLDELEVVGNDYRGNVLAVVKAALADGWLIELLSNASALVPRDDALREMLDRVTPAPPLVLTDHFAACRLSGGHVLIDRSRLRAALRELCEPTGRRVLVVGGPRRTGKSHTTQLIAYLHTVHRTFRVAHVDLEAIARLLGPDPVVTPHDVARRIVRMLDYPLELAAPAGTSWPEWVLTFCEGFESHAMRDDRNPWIVIDGFNHVAAMQATVDLVKELARRIDRFLTGFRLVLLGFEESLAAVSQHTTIETLEQIGAEEVTQFFRDAYQQLGVPWTEQLLLDAAARVLADLHPEQHDYLRVLGDRAGRALAEAAGQSVSA